LEGLGIYDSLIVVELVTFVIGEGVELIVFRISHDVVRCMDLGLTWFQEGLLDFIQHVLLHDGIIQLALAFTVEAETSDFTLHFAFLCGVTIILGTTRHEFQNVVVLVQFTRKIPEVMTQVWVGLSFVCVVDDGVCVVVQDPFSLGFQGLVEFETGSTGGETGDEDVEVG